MTPRNTHAPRRENEKCNDRRCVAKPGGRDAEVKDDMRKRRAYATNRATP